jgi:hypothetical protein
MGFFAAFGEVYRARDTRLDRTVAMDDTTVDLPHDRGRINNGGIP